MAEPYRSCLRSPDGRAIFGFESTEAAETVKPLLDHGAEANARDGEGQSALDPARKRGRDAIAEMLRKAGAEVVIGDRVIGDRVIGDRVIGDSI